MRFRPSIFRTKDLSTLDSAKPHGDDARRLGPAGFKFKPAAIKEPNAAHSAISEHKLALQYTVWAWNDKHDGRPRASARSGQCRGT
jgi:hypothetical protein